MTKLKMKNPFNPKFGKDPAYFVGRKDIESEIDENLCIISSKQDKNGNIDSQVLNPLMILGPRGSGKSAVLNRTLVKAEKLKFPVFIITENDIKNDYQNLYKKLICNHINFYEQVLKDDGYSKDSVDEYIHKLKDINCTYCLERIIKVFVKNSPLVLLIEDAHKLNKKVFVDFAEMLEELALDFYPLAVVYTATPSLLHPFIGKTIWYHANRTHIYRLSKQETINAIKIPFKKISVSIDKDALKELVNATDCFPYFIQVIGRELWKIVYKSKNKIINIEKAKLAVKNSVKRRNKFYEYIGKEVIKSKDKDIYLNIIRNIKKNKNKVLLSDLIDYVNKKYKTNKGVDYIDTLISSGIVWDTDLTITPGVPSFFSYIEKKHSTK